MGVRGIRIMALTSWVAFVAAYFVPYLFEPSDPDLIRLLAWDGYGAVVNQNFLYALPLVVMTFATIGVVFFQNWGRYLYLALAAYMLMSGWLYGYRVSSPLDMFLGGVSGSLVAALLALFFLSPLRSAFRRETGAP